MTIQRKIVNEILEEQKKNPDIIAINIFGSVAKGKERIDSDVDVEIISKNAKKWVLLKKKKYGINIDLVICPKDFLLKRIEQYPYLSYDHLFEKTIYDSEGIMRKVKNKLRVYFKKHPEVVEFWKEKHKIMIENKRKGEDPKDAIKSFDEAEIKFSKEHKLTRNFFRK